ncbi:uncharacterized protein LOC134217611 [Armigeres subalbatus]|uniref:uncharacterized protein LOC134217611 n=1 Tax=Armigeres subalbatus TaxID=124917 RepID=UPI002ED15435
MADQSVFEKLPEYIQTGLKKVAVDQGFTDGAYRFEFEDGSNKGDGFMGELFKVFIRENGREELVVLCKTLPKHEIRKRYTISMFHREVAAYNEVLPLIKKFQVDKGVSEDSVEGFWSFPKSYYAYCDMAKMEGLIVMEDLREKHFRMWNKLEPVNNDHTKLVMRQLGKLHAVSFALKDQQPETFEKFKRFNDPLSQLIAYDPTKGMMRMMNGTCERAVQALDEKDTLYKTKMESVRGVVTDLYQKDATASEAEPYAVLGHGDCWINNMLYSYGKDDTIPTDIRLIDWQLCRYGSPVLDLMYFIFTSTDAQLRAEHYEAWLNTYYESLAEYLKQLDGDAERQFPKVAFEQQLKRFGRFGLLISFLVLPIICTPNVETPDIEKHMEMAMKAKEAKVETPGADEKIFSHTEKSDAMFQSRVRGIIKDVVRLDYL